MTTQLPRQSYIHLDRDRTSTDEPITRIIDAPELLQRAIPLTVNDPKLWKPEDEVSFDGKEWRIKSVDIDLGTVTLKQAGIRLVDAAELRGLNPGRKLVAENHPESESRDTWIVKRSNGVMETGWHAVAIAANGSCTMFKDDAFQVCVDANAVKPNR